MPGPYRTGATVILVDDDERGQPALELDLGASVEQKVERATLHLADVVGREVHAGGLR